MRENYHIPINKRNTKAQIKRFYGNSNLQENWSPLLNSWLDAQKNRIKFKNAAEFRFGPQPLLQLTKEQKESSANNGVKRKRTSFRKASNVDAMEIDGEHESDEDKPKKKKTKLNKDEMKRRLMNVLSEPLSEQMSEHTSDFDDELESGEEEEEDNIPRHGGKRPRDPPSSWSSELDESGSDDVIPFHPPTPHNEDDDWAGFL